MMDDKSKIVKVVEERIRESVEAAKQDIIKTSERKADEAVQRINGVYASILKAIDGLEIKDPTLLDYIEKTKGNIRVYDNIVGHGPRNEFEIHYYGQTLGYDIGKPSASPITLNEKKIYRVIVMAIEEGDVKPG